MKSLVGRVRLSKNEMESRMLAAAKLIENARPPLAVLVFGSYARGDACEESDLDVAIVFESSEEARGAVVPIVMALGQMSIPTDKVFFSRQELCEGAQRGGLPFLIAREHRLVHGIDPFGGMHDTTQT